MQDGKYRNGFYLNSCKDGIPSELPLHVHVASGREIRGGVERRLARRWSSGMDQARQATSTTAQNQSRTSGVGVGADWMPR